MSALCTIPNPRAGPGAPQMECGAPASLGSQRHCACPPSISSHLPFDPVMLEPAGITLVLPYAWSHARCWLNPLIWNQVQQKHEHLLWHLPHPLRVDPASSRHPILSLQCLGNDEAGKRKWSRPNAW